MTNIYLTDEEFDEIENLIVAPTMTMDLNTGITTTTRINKIEAVNRLQEMAKEKGLPNLPEGKGYGLNVSKRILMPNGV